jgi:hypothetical protein
MKAKALEVSDRATFIPMLCVEMSPQPFFSASDSPPNSVYSAAYRDQRYLLRRCGYPCDEYTVILMTRLDGNGKASSDPFYWGDRTFQTAHVYIIEHWDELKDGDVIDVEFILGETSEKTRSERETNPL